MTEKANIQSKIAANETREIFRSPYGAHFTLREEIYHSDHPYVTQGGLDANKSYIVPSRDSGVLIVPYLREDGKDKLLLISEFRNKTGKTFNEFPTGAVKQGESPTAAAARELSSETGYSAGFLVQMGMRDGGYIDPGTIDGFDYPILAVGLKRVGRPHGEKEIVNVASHPVKDLVATMTIQVPENYQRQWGILFVNTFLEQIRALDAAVMRSDVSKIPEAEIGRLTKFLRLGADAS